MSPDADLLQSSFERFVAPRAQEFADRFYDRLFERQPELERLFKSPRERVKQHFVGALTLIVSSLRRPAELTELLTALGGAHAGYGVRSEHYQLAGENLIEVLHEMAGEGWTVELEQAWRRAYSVVQGVMNDGSTEAGCEGADPRTLLGLTARCSGTDPLPTLTEFDPLALATEYLALNRRRREGASSLSVAERERWNELRQLLEELLDAVPPPGSSQRRFLRVPTRLDVEFTGLTDPAKGVLTQIGEGGIFIATEGPLGPGTAVRLEIMRRSKDDTLRVEGIVAWVRAVATQNGPPGMGVRFANLDRERRAEIIDLTARSLFLVLCREERSGT